MTIDQVRKGQPLRQVLTAERINAWNDAARKAVGIDLTSARQSKTIPTPDVIQVRNTTGSALDRFGILGLSAPIFTPTENLPQYKNHVVMDGVSPSAASYTGKFCILQSPAADDAIVPASVSGTSVCQIYVNDESHGFADVKDGDSTQLQSSTCGSAQIIEKEAGIGTVWATVRLGNQICPDLLAPTFAVGTVYSESIEARSGLCVHEGYVKIVDANGVPSGCGDGDSALVDSGETTLAYNLCAYPVGFGEVVSLGFDGLDWFVLDSEDADDECQLWQAVNTHTDSISGWAAGAEVPLATVKVDAGAIANLVDDHAQLAFSGIVKLSYSILTARTITSGGRTNLDTYLEYSTNNGSSWTKIQESQGNMICDNGNTSNHGQVTGFCTYDANAGDRIRLFMDGTSGPGGSDFVAGGTQLMIEPCGRVRPINETDLLIAYWRTHGMMSDETDLINGFVLTNNGGIVTGFHPNAEGPEAWEFDGSDDGFSNSTDDFLDWSQDFTIRVHVRIDDFDNPVSGPPIWNFTMAGTYNGPLSILVVESGSNSILVSEPTSSGLSLGGLSTGVWYTMYLRRRVIDERFDFDIVGVGNDNGTGSAWAATPTLFEVGQDANLGRYFNGLIASIKMWNRRLEDWELV